MQVFGSMLIGAIIGAFGISPYDLNKNAFSFQNTIILLGFVILWQIIYYKIDKK